MRSQNQSSFKEFTQSPGVVIAGALFLCAWAPALLSAQLSFFVIGPRRYYPRGINFVIVSAGCFDSDPFCGKILVNVVFAP